VSPLWRDEIAIFLSPRRIALARRARGLKARLTAASEVAVAEGGIGDYGPALTRLAEILLEPTWQDAAARVVVADLWARYGIVPASNSRLDDQGRRAHARYVFADAYGEGMADWQVVLEDSPPGRASVACAIPGGFKAALDAALAVGRLKVVSVQPLLVVAFNAWRRRLPRGDVWFIALEDGWISAVQLADGVWNRIQAARLSSDSSVEFERMQAFARLMHSAGGGRIFVEASPRIRERVARIGSNLEWLEAPAADGGPAHEIALLLQAGT
jgi:hypothetical protein